MRVPGSYAGQDQNWGREHWNVWKYPKEWRGKEAVYRRMLTIPTDLKGRRVLISFGGVRHGARIEINGKDAGSWWDPYVPIEADITALVKSGTNELKVFVDKDQERYLREDVNANRRGNWLKPSGHSAPREGINRTSD